MFRIATLLTAAALVLALNSPARAADKKQPDQTRTLIGHVVNAQDQAIPKAIVHLKNMRTGQEKSYIADADGGFHFSGLERNSDYEVYAESQGARSDTKTLSIFEPRSQVEMTLRIK